MYCKVNFKGKRTTVKVFFPVILLAAILFTSTTLAACSSPPETGSPGYFLETLSKRGISFSFECPIAYEKSDPNPYESEGSSEDVVGERYLVTYDDTKTSKQINVQLWNPIADYPNAQARLDYYAGNVENVGENPEIIERSPLRVAGIDGEKLVYTYVLEGSADMPSRVYCWVAAFDGKGQIWFLTMGTNIEPPDEAEADFEHLISTFKFLE